MVVVVVTVTAAKLPLKMLFKIFPQIVPGKDCSIYQCNKGKMFFNIAKAKYVSRWEHGILLYFSQIMSGMNWNDSQRLVNKWLTTRVS